MEKINKETQIILRVIFSVCFLGVFLSSPGWGEPTPLGAQKLINQMSEASRKLNYDGIFVYRRGQQVETMRLIHKSDESGEVERLVSLTGSAREIIRNKESVTCIFPDNEAVMVEKSRPNKLFTGLLPEPIEKISQYYSFSISGEDRVAGRQTWVVDISPGDMHRYGYQLWIDKEHHLLLKSKLKNKSGILLEQIMFTQMNVLDVIPDSLLEPSISGTNYTWYEGDKKSSNVHKGVAEHTWKVAWMPSGFELNHYEKQSIAASKTMVDHMAFSDGLAMVSVFVEKMDTKPKTPLGASSMGGVNAFAKFSNGYQVTAVGEVPQITVQKMANSVVAVQ